MRKLKLSSTDLFDTSAALQNILHPGLCYVGSIRIELHKLIDFNRF